jgi:hypothetical protein
MVIMQVIFRNFLLRKYLQKQQVGAVPVLSGAPCCYIGTGDRGLDNVPGRYITGDTTG